MGPTVAAPPFPPEHELKFRSKTDSTSPGTLPGFPHLSLDDRPPLWAFLATQLWADDLEAIADRLWWMSKQDSASISPLHRQAVKGRAIVVTEDPKLHLVWIDNRIFIKPLPRYLLSHAFWRDHLCAAKDHCTAKARGAADDELRARVCAAALGYLRTYRHLVRFESDLRVAQDPRLCLVPEEVSWADFSRFAADLAAIVDDDVSPRYCYGEIRLTRLNFYAPFLLGRSHFQRVESQYAAYFSRFFAPILFVIGVTSVILGALQVAVAVDQDQAKSGRVIANVALWLSIVVILIFCILLLGLATLLAYKVANEWRYAIADRRRILKRKKAMARPVDA